MPIPPTRNTAFSSATTTAAIVATSILSSSSHRAPQIGNPRVVIRCDSEYRSLNPVRVYETSDIRNVALIGHGHSGKTSLTSGLLYTTGAASRLTRVDEGASITDFD